MFSVAIDFILCVICTLRISYTLCHVIAIEYSAHITTKHFTYRDTYPHISLITNNWSQFSATVIAGFGLNGVEFIFVSHPELLHMCQIENHHFCTLQVKLVFFHALQINIYTTSYHIIFYIVLHIDMLWLHYLWRNSKGRYFTGDTDISSSWPLAAHVLHAINLAKCLLAFRYSWNWKPEMATSGNSTWIHRLLEIPWAILLAMLSLIRTFVMVTSFGI